VSRPGEILENFIDSILKILCLGNNTENTDIRTRQLAKSVDKVCYGLLSELETSLKSVDYQLPGYYHSSIYDIEFGRLIDIGNEFDQVIMLDQPVEQWSHPDAFYNTVRIMQNLSVPTLFLDSSFLISIDYFSQLVKTNQSFCAFPFIELLVDRGNTTVCCRSATPVAPIAELKNYRTDPHYQEIRQKMIRGERISEHCRSCYDLEDMGITSARKQETVEWANRLRFHTIDDFLAVEKPFYYEVRPSNKCNLQCRMCGPSSSHLIDQEYRRLGLVDQSLPPIEKFGGGFEIVNFDNLQKLYVAGGEPLIMPETYEFLERCIRERHTDFELLINTNGTKLSEKFKNVLNQFSNLQFIFSIDAFDRLNHYIRWPSDWDTIINNWRYLREHGHKVTVNTTVSIYNVHRLHELYEFIDLEFPNTLTHCQIVEEPHCLSPWLFPDYQRALVSLRRVKDTNCARNDMLFANNIEGYIRIFEKQSRPDRQLMREFYQFNDLLDSSRAIRLEDYLPELESHRNHLIR
jgi:hypothetical protein